jgi:hypothetical protein
MSNTNNQSPTDQNIDQPQIRSRKTYVAMLMLSHKRLKSREVNLSVFTMDARRKSSINPFSATGLENA